MTEERTSAPAGVFDQRPAPKVQPQSVSEQKPKEEFVDIFQQSEIERSKLLQKKKLPSLSELAAEKTQAALGNSDSVDKDIADMEKISEEDMDLAEQLIFKGYAQFDASMKNFPKFKFTICSTSAEEMSVIDEMIYDILKNAKERPDGTVDIPQNHISTMRNALYVALSYRGLNQKELMEGTPSCYLNTIKNAIINYVELFNSGKIEEGNKLKEDLKNSLMRRASAVKKMPTPTIDFISGAKFEFDAKMLRIMSEKDILPKS